MKLAALAACLICLVPTSASANPQVSARLALGGGFLDDDGQDGRPLFEMALRSELLFGPNAVRSFRVGPAIDLRTEAFDTTEVAGGVALLAPVATGFPLVLTAGAGWASRPGDEDAPFFLGTAAWGYRPYNHHAVYGFGMSFYVSTRVDLDTPDRFQISAGVEIDLQFLLFIPAVFLWEWITGGDPDEPEEEDE